MVNHSYHLLSLRNRLWAVAVRGKSLCFRFSEGIIQNNSDTLCSLFRRSATYLRLNIFLILQITEAAIHGGSLK